MDYRFIGKSEDGSKIVLHKFDGNFKVEPSLAKDSEKLRKAVVLDVETTGLNRFQDEVIEIGLRLFEFHKEKGVLTKIVDSYCEFQEPKKPISKEITEITGITNEMVKGKKINWDRVNQIITQADLIIAHNATFDRGFVDQKSDASKEKIWSCSFQNIDWRSKKYPSQKLELLTVFHGFFSDAHRALSDADALLHLLTFSDEQTGKTYLLELLENAKKSQVRVVASQTPYESRMYFKNKRYQWDQVSKAWVKTFYQEELEEEVLSLEEKVYRGPFLGKVIEIPLKDHFKSY